MRKWEEVFETALAVGTLVFIGYSVVWLSLSWAGVL